MEKEADYMPAMSRRSMLGATSASLAGLGLASCSIPANGAKVVAPQVPALDLTNPQDNVEAIVKIQGDTSGKKMYSWGHGHIYGAIDGQLTIPMLRYQLMRVGRHLRQDDGSYLFKYRGAIFYQDYDTGAFIDEFYNPITKEIVPVKHWKSSIGQFLYTALGPVTTRKFTGNFGKEYRGKPYILPWLRGGDRVWVMLDERVEYKRPSDGVWRRDNAILRYEAPWDELMDPGRTFCSSSSSFQTDIAWFTWLNMKDQRGSMIQGGMGRKFEAIDDLPKDFVAFAEERYPGVLTDPIPASRSQLDHQR